MAQDTRAGAAAAARRTATLPTTIFALCLSQTYPNPNLSLPLHITRGQYFYGLNNSIVHGNVRAILDSVVPGLSLSPSRKFTCVCRPCSCVKL